MSDLTITIRHRPIHGAAWSASAYEAVVGRHPSVQFYYGPTEEIVLAKVLAGVMQQKERENEDAVHRGEE
jgi:hypothetical protein